MGNSLGCLSHEGFQVSPNPARKSKQRHHQCLNIAPLNKWFQRRSMSLPGKQQKEMVKKKGVTRVKVVLSKEEAAQLLALFAHRKEMMAVKTMHRLGTVLRTTCRHQSYRQWKPVLASIPELI